MSKFKEISNSDGINSSNEAQNPGKLLHSRVVIK